MRNLRLTLATADNLKKRGLNLAYEKFIGNPIKAKNKQIMYLFCFLLIFSILSILCIYFLIPLGFCLIFILCIYLQKRNLNRKSFSAAEIEIFITKIKDDWELEKKERKEYYKTLASLGKNREIEKIILQNQEEDKLFQSNLDGLRNLKREVEKVELPPPIPKTKIT